MRHILINPKPTNSYAAEATPPQWRLLQNMIYTRGIQRRGPLGGTTGQNSQPQVHYDLDKSYIYTRELGNSHMIYSTFLAKENGVE